MLVIYVLQNMKGRKIIMYVKNFISSQVQKEITDKLINTLTNTISMGITYAEKAMLATARSKLGYEMSLSDQDKTRMFKILENIDPKQYCKYCISAKDEDNDLMAKPLRNNVTYLTTLKGLYTWILVSTRSWDVNVIDYTSSDELNLFIFGLYADVIHDMLVERFNPRTLTIKSADTDESIAPYIKTYKMSTNKNKDEGRIDYQGYKQVKAIEQIFTEQEQLSNIINYIDKWNEASQFFANRGITHKLGILMYGPPGTGKTSLAQAIAGHYEFPLVTLDPGSFCHATISRIQNHNFDSTFILLLEDIDYIFGKPKDEQTSEEKERSNLLLQFLDGVHSVPNAIIIATTNDYDSLEAAIVREGRFDKKIFMDNLDKEQASKMIQELNITNVPFELSEEEYPINPASLQAKLFNHVFDNIDNLATLTHKEENEQEKARRELIDELMELTHIS